MTYAGPWRQPKEHQERLFSPNHHNTVLWMHHFCEQVVTLIRHSSLWDRQMSSLRFSIFNWLWKMHLVGWLWGPLVLSNKLAGQGEHEVCWLLLSQRKLITDIASLGLFPPERLSNLVQGINNRAQFSSSHPPSSSTVTHYCYWLCNDLIIPPTPEWFCGVLSHKTETRWEISSMKC